MSIQSNDTFSAAGVTALLTGAAASLPVEFREEVTSTNTVLKEEAKAQRCQTFSKGAVQNAPSRYAENAERVLIAERQSAGKGRMGRSFHSPKSSGLYMSLLLRPRMTPEHATLLTTLAAVAVAEAIEQVTGDPVDIKWVNDVYRNGRKLCGILTEAAVDLESGMLEYAIVGIGVNLTDPEGGFPPEIRETAGSLYGENTCPAEKKTALAAAILNNFMDYYERLPETAFLDGYRKRSFLLGQDILILGAMTPDGGHIREAREAHAEYIDDQLRLVVTYPDGTTEALSSGEVSTRLLRGSKSPK